MVAAVLHSPVPTSSSLWRPGTTHNTWESRGAVGVAARGVEERGALRGGGRNRSCW